MVSILSTKASPASDCVPEDTSSPWPFLPLYELFTAGSIVIHYDRWWNAAREDQATDRVHRIGQTRGVQVFKLVTKNTFEEKIDALILKKGKLMEEVVGTDDHQFVKTFTRGELEDLLEYVERE